MAITAASVDARALAALRQMFGPAAQFRDGQLEAIRALVEARQRILVVQQTGWGKSVVYFIATRLLRDLGAGPTLLVSPLLALMRNQVELAQRIGIRAETINSSNADDWVDVRAALDDDACDILLISPERLANRAFVEDTLPRLQGGVGMLVVDEAHCISDWGHDFRPDYRRIVRIVRFLPPNVPVAATTATANDRVVRDVVEQLGPNVQVQRGPLARATLRLQSIHLADQAERLAWLAEHLPAMPGSGIVYCLTIADCQRVAEWLVSRGIRALPYHGALENETRIEREQALITNRVKVLVATIALGMGFDKPDLGFVVHFQRPGSLVAYYQQIGRAGRAIEQAYAVLLNGREDEEISQYFIDTAFPGAPAMHAVLDVLEAYDALTLSQVQAHVNMARGRLERCLKLLEVDGAVLREGSRYVRTANPWQADEPRWAGISAQRVREVERMRAFASATTCLMAFVAGELDDPRPAPCGRCAACVGPLLPETADRRLTEAAVRFLRRSYLPLEPRKQWPAGLEAGSSRIPQGERNEQGRVLSVYGDAGWGRDVKVAKTRLGRFDDTLVDGCLEMLREWAPEPAPAWVTAVPSRRHPALVADFAERLARRLRVPYSPALVKTRDNAPQKTMQNSYQQARNVRAAFEAEAEHVLEGPVLLVDDMVDSGWTLAVCGSLLRRAGSGPVFPMALASTTTGGGD